MSAPLPGPSVRMNFTGRVGHACADAGVAARSAAHSVVRVRAQAMNAREMRCPPVILFPPIVIVFSFR